MQGVSARTVMFDPRPILGVLARHEVRFVVIGGVAASLQGVTAIPDEIRTFFAPDYKNLVRLAGGLWDGGGNPPGVARAVAARLVAPTPKAGVVFVFHT